MKRQRGSGITAYTHEAVSVEGREARQAFKQFTEAKTKGDLHFQSREARAVVAVILQGDDGGPVEAHSKIDFARQIHRDLDLADRMIAEGDADKAAGFAFTAASAWATMVMKFSWEVDALRGEKVAGGARNSAHQTNSRHEDLRQRRFAQMRHHIANGLVVESAANACEAEGLGKAEAIKRQWNRHRRNRDTYTTVPKHNCQS